MCVCMAAIWKQYKFMYYTESIDVQIYSMILFF